jgi:hypothetical protein
MVGNGSGDWSRLRCNSRVASTITHGNQTPSTSRWSRAAHGCNGQTNPDARKEDCAVGLVHPRRIVRLAIDIPAERKEPGHQETDSPPHSQSRRRDRRSAKCDSCPSTCDSCPSTGVRAHCSKHEGRAHPGPAPRAVILSDNRRGRIPPVARPHLSPGRSRSRTSRIRPSSTPAPLPPGSARP